MKTILKKKGRMIVSKQLIETMPVECLALFFGNFYPINIELSGWDNLEYYGYSEYFEEVKEGTIIPQYEAIFTYIEESDSHTVEFKKRDV